MDDYKNKIYVVTDSETGKSKYLNVPTDKEELLKKKLPNARLANEDDLDAFVKVNGGWGLKSTDFGDFATKQQADATINQVSAFIDDFNKSDGNTSIDERRKNTLKDLGVNVGLYEGISDYEKRKLATDEVIATDNSINTFKKNREFINDVINNSSDNPYDDNYLPKNVKKELQEWYDTEVEPYKGEDKLESPVNRLSKQAQRYLDDHAIKGTATSGDTRGSNPEVALPSFSYEYSYNTDEQKKLVEDWENNTEFGRQVKQAEIDYLNGLDKAIDDLEAKIRDKDVESVTSNVELSKPYGDLEGGATEYMRMTRMEKKEYNKEREEKIKAHRELYPIADSMNAKSQLNELKKIRDRAYDFNNKGAMASFFNQFGRTIGWEGLNTVLFGLPQLAGNMDLKETLEKHPDGLTADAYHLLQEYANARSLDYGISQEISDGVTQTIPFMAEFALSGGAISGAKAGLKKATTKYLLPKLVKARDSYRAIDVATKSAIKLNKYANSKLVGRMAINLSTDVMDAGAKAFIMPSTYADTYDLLIEDQDKGFLDAFANRWFINTIANYSEQLGDRMTIFEKFNPKNKKLKQIMDVTGIQSFPAEYLEENAETAINAFFETGEGEWADLIDPRNQLVTASTVALIQAPYATINTGSYVAGVTRNLKQQRSINKAYDSSSRYVLLALEDRAKEALASIEEVVNNNEANLNDAVAVLSYKILSDNNLTATQKDALFKHTMAYLAKYSMAKAKQDVRNHQEKAILEDVEELSDGEGQIKMIKVSQSESPVFVTKGDIVLTQDGQIDEEASSKEVYIFNDKNNTIEVVPIGNVQELITQAATGEVVNQAIVEKIEPQERQEQLEEKATHIYLPNHQVRFRQVAQNGDVVNYAGVVVDYDEVSHHYIIKEYYSEELIEVSALDIYDADNLEGIEAGVTFYYEDKNGNIVSGVADTDIRLMDLANGTIYVNGDVVPLDNIIGIDYNAEDKQVNVNDVGTIEDLSNKVEASTIDAMREVEGKEDDINLQYVRVDEGNITEGQSIIVAELPTGEKIQLTEEFNINSLSDTYLQDNREALIDKYKAIYNDVIGRQYKVKEENKTIEPVKLDESGNPLYTSSPVVSTITDLKGRLGEVTDVQKFIEANIEASISNLETIKEPKATTDINEYQRQVQENRKLREKYEQEKSYWESALIELYESSKEGELKKNDVTYNTIREATSKSLMSKLKSSIDDVSDFTAITAEQATTILDAISDINRNLNDDSYFLDDAQKEELDNITNILNKYGYEIKDNKGHVLQDADQYTIRNVADSPELEAGYKAEDTSLVIDTEIKPTITHNGNVIRYGEYDAIRQYSRDYTRRKQNAQYELEKEKEYQKEIAQLKQEAIEANEEALKYRMPRIELLDFATEEMLWNIADNSTDVYELYRAYFTEMDRLDVENLMPWEQHLLGARVNPESFAEFNDRNNISPTVAISWLASKDSRGNYPRHTHIDAIAQSLSQYGKEVTTEMVCEFILAHPTNRIRKTSDLSIALDVRFRKIANELFDNNQKIWGCESESATRFMATYVAIMNNESVINTLAEKAKETKVPDQFVDIMTSIKAFEDTETIDDIIETLESNKDKFNGFPFTQENYNEIKQYLEDEREKGADKETIQRWTEIYDDIRGVQKKLFGDGEKQTEKEQVKSYDDVLYHELAELNEELESLEEQEGYISNSEYESYTQYVEETKRRISEVKSELDLITEFSASEEIAREQADIAQEQPAQPVEESAAQPKPNVEEVPKVEKPKVKPIEEVKAKPFGADNKFVKNDEIEDLKRQLRDKLNNLNIGLDPDMLKLSIKITAYYIEGGLNKFKDYAKQMIAEFGDVIVPHLKQFYVSTMLDPSTPVELKDKMTPVQDVVAMTDEQIANLVNEEVETEIQTETETENEKPQDTINQLSDYLVEQYYNAQENNDEKARYSRIDTEKNFPVAINYMLERDASLTDPSLQGVIERSIDSLIGAMVLLNRRELSNGVVEGIGVEQVRELRKGGELREELKKNIINSFKKKNNIKVDTEVETKTEVEAKTEVQQEAKTQTQEKAQQTQQEAKETKEKAKDDVIDSDNIEGKQNVITRFKRTLHDKAKDIAEQNGKVETAKSHVGSINVSVLGITEPHKTNKLDWTYNVTFGVKGSPELEITLTSPIDVETERDLNTNDAYKIKRIREHQGEREGVNFVTLTGEGYEVLGKVALEGHTIEEVSNAIDKLLNKQNDEGKRTNEDRGGESSSTTTSRTQPSLFDFQDEGKPQTTTTGDSKKGSKVQGVGSEGIKPSTRQTGDTGSRKGDTSTILHTEQSAGERGDVRGGRTSRGDTKQTSKPVKNKRNNKQKVTDIVVPTGKVGKIKANINAIKLAKMLTESGREASTSEMRILRQYTGWGGLAEVFKTDNPHYNEVKEVLTQEEYESARASTTTAFYTPAEITNSLWDIAVKLGVKGGNILEPSAGIGNVLSLMPESISENANIKGVELDNISGTILKLLYPDADIEIGGYEHQRIPNNSQDLIITNVPFGQFKVFDANETDISKNFNIHDYFIAKSIKKLKAGGIAIFITTSSTLDNSTTKIRSWISDTGNADIIDAVRLNTETFKEDAGTQATSDIIIVRKRDESGRSPHAKEMRDTNIVREIKYDTYENFKPVRKTAYLSYNQYFVDNPHRMAGEMKLGVEGGNAMRPTEQRLAPTSNVSQAEVIQQMINELPENISDTKKAKEQAPNLTKNDNPIIGKAKEGGLMIIDGKAYIKVFDEAQAVDWNNNKVRGKYTKEQVLQEYLKLKDALEQTILSQVENRSDAEIEKNIKDLNRIYDYFVKRFGTLTDSRVLGFLKDDVDYVSVQAIEDKVDNNGKVSYEKAEIFKHRVIEAQAEPKAESVEDAINVSVAYNGSIEMAFVENLLGRPQEEIRKEMLDKSLAFINPNTGLVEDRANYLSGNVRQKLKEAKEANINGEYNKNIKELTKVVPPTVPLSLIRLELGSSWIPLEVYNKYFNDVFGVHVEFVRTPLDKYVAKPVVEDRAKDNRMGLPDVIGGHQLAIHQMNGTQANIYKTTYEGGKKSTTLDVKATHLARLKQTELSDHFENWAKAHPEYNKQLETIYNEQYNSIAEKKVEADSFDRFPNAGGLVVMMEAKKLDNGNFLYQYRPAKENTEKDNKNIKGIAKEIGLEYNEKEGIYTTQDISKGGQFVKRTNGDTKILRKHQREGVLRGLSSPTLLAHEVGTGKTLTLITTAMEMRRLGLANKPCIIVQRSTYEQFVKEIKNQYPNAKVLAPNAKDLRAKERQSLFAKIAYNDWDIVVLYHDYLDRIPDDPRREAQLIQEKIDERISIMMELDDLRGQGSNAGMMSGAIRREIDGLKKELENKIKQVEKVKAGVASSVKEKLHRSTDKTLFFEQLGIDALLIDEAHGYKRLGFYTSYNRIKGIDTSASKKAQSTRLKTRFILDKTNGRNIVMATGTPISNTMAEMWTFLRYLLPDEEMQRLQVNNFDSFVKTFGNIVESPEFNTSGKFQMTNRFSSYKNLPELLSAWKQVAHTVLTEEIPSLKSGVGTPVIEGGGPTDVIITQSPQLRSIMAGIKEILEWYNKLSGKEKMEPLNRAIPMMMFNIAKRSAIDVRLVDSSLPDHKDSKLNKSIDLTLDALEETKSYKGVVAIFCDDKQSSDKKFNVFEDIKQKLIKRGVSEDQVAIIDDYNTDNKRAELFEKVNSGDIRVIMGGTERLGTGVNIQERLHTLIHLDVPIKPSEYQQRNGRIERQGNIHLTMGKPIRILRIGVENTLDVTGYQRLAIKENFIRQIMKGDMQERILEEEDSDNASDGGNFNVMMANLSGSQSALVLTQRQNELKRLEAREREHNESQIFYYNAVENAKAKIETTELMIDRYKKYQEHLDNVFPETSLHTIEYEGKKYSTEEDRAKIVSDIKADIEKTHKEIRDDKSKAYSTKSYDIEINNVPAEIVVSFERNVLVSSENRVTKDISIRTKDNIDIFPKREGAVVPTIHVNVGANLSNMEARLNDHLSRSVVNNNIAKREIGLEENKNEIRTYEPLIGQEFTQTEKIQELKEEVEQLELQTEQDIENIELEQKVAMEGVEIYDFKEYLAERRKDKEEAERAKNNPSFHYSNTSNTSNKFHRNKLEVEILAIVDKLKQTGLAKDVTIIDKIPQDVKSKLVNPNTSQVYGYVNESGEIFLLRDKLNLNTPIHEFGHLWINYIGQFNQALFMKGRELILQSEYWDKVNNNEQYKNLPFEERLDEALAMAIGDKGELSLDTTMQQRIKRWINDVWETIKKFLGLQKDAPIGEMTLGNFIDTALGDLLAGKELEKINTLQSNENLKFDSVEDYVDDVVGPTTPDMHRDNLDRKLNMVIGKYNLSKLRESFQDRYLPVRKFIDYLREQGVEVEEHNDYYLNATHVFGQIDALLDKYREKYHNPLIESIRSIMDKGYTYREIENYVMLKHGLERNSYMTQRDIERKITPRDDYAGIEAIEFEVNMSAEQYIKEFESGMEKDIENLWKTINNATDNSINLLYEGGIIDKELLEEFKERYEFYVPLRGHDDVTAEDRWEVYDMTGSRFETPVKKAKGRSSRAFAPFAYIFNINQSAINLSRKNLLNQTMLRLAQKDKTGLLSASETWFEYVGEVDGVPQYEARHAEFSLDEETRAKNLEQFQAKMEKLESEGLAYRGHANKAKLGDMFIKPHQEKEHHIQVWQNGRQMSVIVNADASIAKAINGTNVEHNSKILESVAKVNRFMASNFTTRNPKFIFTNAIRDYIFGSSMLGIKEDFKYFAKFQLNILPSMAAVARYNFNKSNPSNTTDAMVIEYVMNGGETGYSHFLEVGKVQKQIEKEIAKGKTSKHLGNHILDFISRANNIAENYSRFATYKTSRELGRSIARSINDAKNVTVNFNQRGSNASVKNMSLLSSRHINAFYLFTNVGIQALDNFAKAFKANPKKATAVIAGFASTGMFLIPLLNQLLAGGTGDDGEDVMDEYFKLGEWERQNNFCIWTGKGFMKIPLAHEVRVFHALGDNVLQVVTGQKETTDAMLDQVIAFSDLVPTNPMGAVDASWAELVPDMMKPFAQLSTNTKFTGSPIYNKWANEWESGDKQARTTKTGVPYAPTFLISSLAMLDRATGGDGIKKGKISINPDKADHLLNGYFGGLYTLVAQSVDASFKTAEYALDKRERLGIRVKDTPFSSFYVNQDELNFSSSGVSRTFYNIRDNVYRDRKYSKDYFRLYMHKELTYKEYLDKVNALYFTPDVARSFMPSIKRVEALTKRMRDMTEEEQVRAENEIARLQNNVVEQYKEVKGRK